MTTTLQRPAATRPTAHETPLTGTGTLLRLIARRDRIRVPVWIAAVAGVMIAGAASYPGIYPTQAHRQAQAVIFESSPAMKAMAGPGHGVENYTFGAMMTNEYLGVMVIFAGLMSVFMVVRHTRAEEEEGRAELVRANAAGSSAHLTAALVGAVVANVALALVIALGMGSLGIESIDWPGSFLYGAAFGAVGIVFAATAAVTSQVTQYARAASGMAGALIGLAYLVRAIGDILDNGLSWLSPIGWAQATAAYVDNNWAPIGLAVLVAAVLVAVAFRLSARRDLGAGLRPERTGARSASALLGTPLGFALRLQRSAFLWWALAMFVLGMSYGSAVDIVEDYAGNEVVTQLIEAMGGGSLTEAYVSMIVALLAIVGAIFAVTSALRPRREETSGRAEGVLATSISRTHWYASHLVIAIVGSLLILVTTGLGLGLAALAVSGETDLIGQAIPAIVSYAPAVWVCAGLAVLAVGWAPRATLVAWILIVYAFFVVYLGGLLGLPDWMVDLSPFAHVARMPTDDFSAPPLVVLTLIAAGLLALGLIGFRRRDLEVT